VRHRKSELNELHEADGDEAVDECKDFTRTAPSQTENSPQSSTNSDCYHGFFEGADVPVNIAQESAMCLELGQ
jgi:hypothetical protein